MLALQTARSFACASTSKKFLLVFKQDRVSSFFDNRRIMCLIKAVFPFLLWMMTAGLCAFVGQVDHRVLAPDHNRSMLRALCHSKSIRRIVCSHKTLLANILALDDKRIMYLVQNY